MSEKRQADTGNKESRDSGSKRRFLLPLIAVIVLVAAAAVFYFLSDDTIGQEPLSARITKTEGSVLVQRGGDAVAEPAETGMELESGDIVSTSGDSSVEVEFDDGSISRAGSDTRLVFSDLYRTRDGSDVTVISVEPGRLWNSVKELTGRNSRFEVRTPTSVAGVRGTCYSVEVTEGGDDDNSGDNDNGEAPGGGSGDPRATYRVYDGEVGVGSGDPDDDDDETTVGKGQQTTVDKDTPPPPAKPLDVLAVDDWERDNLAEDLPLTYVDVETETNTVLVKITEENINKNRERGNELQSELDYLRELLAAETDPARRAQLQELIDLTEEEMNLLTELLSVMEEDMQDLLEDRERLEELRKRIEEQRETVDEETLTNLVREEARSLREEARKRAPQREERRTRTVEIERTITERDERRRETSSQAGVDLSAARDRVPAPDPPAEDPPPPPPPPPSPDPDPEPDPTPEPEPAPTPSAMNITVQPTQANAGSAISPPPAVRITDARGNPVAGIAVTVSPDRGRFSSGTLTVRTNNRGVAAFGDLVINTSGDYTLRFSASGLPAVTSAGYRVVSSGINAGQSEVKCASPVSAGENNVKPEITIRDRYGNPVNGTFDVIIRHEGDNWLDRRLTFSGGKASSGITVKTAGTYKDVLVSVNGTWIGGFDLTVEAGAPAVAEITVQPSDTAAGAVIEPAPAVTFTDAFNNKVYVENVTVTLNGADFASGTTTVSTGDDGTAVFDNLVINKAGTYTLTFSAENLEDVTSDEFTVIDPRILFTRGPAYGEKWLAGHGWIPGSAITVTIKDNGEEIFTDNVTAEDAEHHSFFIDLSSKITHIEAGYTITVSDGIAVRTHTVKALEISHADRETGRVTGTAEPGSAVKLELLEWISGVGPDFLHKVTVDADYAGNWFYNFGDAGFELDGREIRASREDEHGNRTMVCKGLWPALWVMPHHIQVDKPEEGDTVIEDYSGEFHLYLGYTDFIEDLSGANFRLGGVFEGLTVDNAVKNEHFPGEAVITVSGTLTITEEQWTEDPWGGFWTEGFITIPAEGHTGERDLDVRIEVHPYPPDIFTDYHHIDVEIYEGENDVPFTREILISLGKEQFNENVTADDFVLGGIFTDTLYAKELKISSVEEYEHPYMPVSTVKITFAGYLNISHDDWEAMDWHTEGTITALAGCHSGNEDLEAVIYVSPPPEPFWVEPNHINVPIYEEGTEDVYIDKTFIFRLGHDELLHEEPGNVDFSTGGIFADLQVETDAVYNRQYGSLTVSGILNITQDEWDEINESAEGTISLSAADHTGDEDLVATVYVHPPPEPLWAEPHHIHVEFYDDETDVEFYEVFHLYLSYDEFNEVLSAADFALGGIFAHPDYADLEITGAIRDDDVHCNIAVITVEGTLNITEEYWYAVYNEGDEGTSTITALATGHSGDDDITAVIWVSPMPEEFRVTPSDVFIDIHDSEFHQQFDVELGFDDFAEPLQPADFLLGGFFADYLEDTQISITEVYHDGHAVIEVSGNLSITEEDWYLLDYYDTGSITLTEEGHTGTGSHTANVHVFTNRPEAAWAKACPTWIYTAPWEGYRDVLLEEFIYIIIPEGSYVENLSAEHFALGGILDSTFANLEIVEAQKEYNNEADIVIQGTLNIPADYWYENGWVLEGHITVKPEAHTGSGNFEAPVFIGTWGNTETSADPGYIGIIIDENQFSREFDIRLPDDISFNENLTETDFELGGLFADTEYTNLTITDFFRDETEDNLLSVAISGTVDIDIDDWYALGRYDFGYITVKESAHTGDGSRLAFVEIYPDFSGRWMEINPSWVEIPHYDGERDYHFEKIFTITLPEDTVFNNPSENDFALAAVFSDSLYTDDLAVTKVSEDPDIDNAVDITVSGTLNIEWGMGHEEHFFIGEGEYLLQEGCYHELFGLVIAKASGHSGDNDFYSQVSLYSRYESAWAFPYEINIPVYDGDNHVPFDQVIEVNLDYYDDLFIENIDTSNFELDGIFNHPDYADLTITDAARHETDLYTALVTVSGFLSIAESDWDMMDGYTTGIIKVLPEAYDGYSILDTYVELLPLDPPDVWIDPVYVDIPIYDDSDDPVSFTQSFELTLEYGEFKEDLSGVTFEFGEVFADPDYDVSFTDISAERHETRHNTAVLTGSLTPGISESDWEANNWNGFEASIILPSDAHNVYYILTAPFLLEPRDEMAATPVDFLIQPDSSNNVTISQMVEFELVDEEFNIGVDLNSHFSIGGTIENVTAQASYFSFFIDEESIVNNSKVEASFEVELPYNDIDVFTNNVAGITVMLDEAAHSGSRDLEIPFFSTTAVADPFCIDYQKHYDTSQKTFIITLSNGTFADNIEEEAFSNEIENFEFYGLFDGAWLNINSIDSNTVSIFICCPISVTDDAGIIIKESAHSGQGTINLAIADITETCPECGETDCEGDCNGINNECETDPGNPCGYCEWCSTMKEMASASPGELDVEVDWPLDDQIDFDFIEIILEEGSQFHSGITEAGFTLGGVFADPDFFDPFNEITITNANRDETDFHKALLTLEGEFNTTFENKMGYIIIDSGIHEGDSDITVFITVTADDYYYENGNGYECDPDYPCGDPDCHYCGNGNGEY